MIRALVLNERDPEHPRAGGAETHVMEIFSRLAARGMAVTLASSAFPGAATRTRKREVEIRRRGDIPGYYPLVAASCARQTRRGRFDVVVDCLNKVPFLSPFYSGVPVLALCHHLFGRTAFEQVSWPVATAVVAAERLIPVAYRNSTVVAISESTRDDLIARGLRASQIEVHHPGIRRPAAPPVPIAQRGPEVIYVGRLEPYKNIELVLRAVALIARQIPDVTLSIVGEGGDRARLEALARATGIAARTRFTGFVDDAQRDRLLGRARVCVCASSKEGWGLSVIEANALGTPNVTSDAPGLRDSVRHGETGFLVSKDSASRFAEPILALLSDDALADRMSRAAALWSQRFDWERAAGRMQAAIERACHVAVQGEKRVWR